VATSISCGVPCFVDDCDEDAQSPYRQYDIGTRLYNAGTATANQVPSGVYPGNGAMAVTAATGMNISVAAGYCAVANSASSLQGGYVFGLMTAGQLTVAAADTTNPRIDLAVAAVNDLGNDSSSSYVGLVTGTPAATPSPPSPPVNSLILAQIAVAANVTSIVAGNITDERSYVVAPGGILPIQNAAAAPAVPESQFMYNLATGQLVQGTGTAGTVSVSSNTKWAPQATYLTSPVTAAHAGTLTTLATVSVSTDGVTDIEIYTKWAYILGSAAQMTLQVQIDGTQVDEVNVTAAGSPDTGGGSSRYFTSSSQGTTPSAGTHAITWLFQASGSGTSTSDGVFAASTAPGILRISPVAV
jgi:hypothetical protein